MSVEEELEAWRRKWEAKGLPPALLDEMIEEARREWETLMGYVDVKLFYDLVINVIDPAPGGEYAYLYVLKLGSDVVRGRLDAATTQTFKEVPAGPVDIEVYKIDAEGRPAAFGRKLIVLARDMYVDLELEAIVAPVGLGAMPEADVAFALAAPARPPAAPLPAAALLLPLARAYAAGLRLLLPPIMYLLRPAPSRPLGAIVASLYLAHAVAALKALGVAGVQASVGPAPPRPAATAAAALSMSASSIPSPLSPSASLSAALGAAPPRPTAQALSTFALSVGVRKSP